MGKKLLFFVLFASLFFGTANYGAEAAQKKCLKGDGLKYTIPGEWYMKMVKGRINLETALQYSKKEVVKRAEICFNPKWGGVKVDLDGESLKFDAEDPGYPDTRSVPIVSLFTGFRDAYSRFEYFVKKADENGKVAGVSSVAWDGKDEEENKKIDMIRFQIKDIKYGHAVPKNLGLEWVGYPEFVEWYVGNVMTEEVQIAVGKKPESVKEITLEQLNKQIKAVEDLQQTVK